MKLERKLEEVKGEKRMWAATSLKRTREEENREEREERRVLGAFKRFESSGDSDLAFNLNRASTSSCSRSSMRR